MKLNKITYAAAILAATGAFSSCSDNYLDLKPETTVTNGQVTASVDAAELAMRGICMAMWSQYQQIQGEGTTNYMNFNGEAYINHRYGDGLGPDMHGGAIMYNFTPELLCGGTLWDDDGYIINAIPWKYAYNLIQQANTILDGIDHAEGDEKERDFIKAQVLTLRAHAYVKLVQFYAPRWEDSRNGEVYCMVKRVNGSTDAAPLMTLNEAYQIIYGDLDNAINLYKSSGLKREFKWMPDLNVAYGIYARAAMIKHDYAIAQEMAHNASDGYVVMDNDTFLSGFYVDNNDFMWTSSSDQTDLYYWSEYNWGQAANGGYTKNWSLVDAIDIDLYNQLDPKDIRRQCYLTPDKVDVLNAENKKLYNPGDIVAADWWNSDLVVESKNCALNYGAYAKDKKDPKKKWGLYNVALFYSKYYGENIFKGDYESIKIFDTESKLTQYGYYMLGSKGDLRLDKTNYASLNEIVFGAQYKFWSEPNYGGGSYPFMRASEMKLVEAEAAYYNDDKTTALNLLKEINGKRIPGYAFNQTDSKLLDEIRLCRRIELWGEGHNWFDFKRWNLPIVRRAWKPNDPTSGNWQAEFGQNTPVNVNRGWSVKIPRTEWRYNNAIDRNLLDY